MTDFPDDPLTAFEEALRVARAATHERKLDRPVAEAFAAIVAAGHAAVAAFRDLERRIAELKRPPELQNDAPSFFDD